MTTYVHDMQPLNAPGDGDGHWQCTHCKLETSSRGRLKKDKTGKPWYAARPIEQIPCDPDLPLTGPGWFESPPVL